MSLTQQDVRSLLERTIEPVSLQPLSALLIDLRLLIEGGTARVQLVFAIPVFGLRDWVGELIRNELGPEFGLDIQVDSSCSIEDRASEALPGVKNLIAVASGKGGVGKSSTAVNLALALRAEGARVGLMDADIYGPSIPKMLGIPSEERPRVVGENRFAPIEVYGIQTLSMGNLMTDQTPAVWRGPMASGAFQQLLTQTLWHELDFLIVDMPPGTGDIQLTLAQKAPVAGAVIVTTPQDIALADAIRGIEMFRKVDIPVLGIVENMSTHICSACGHVEPLFGSGGADRLSADYGVSVLGKLPLVMQIREDLDRGMPTVVSQPDGEIATAYRNIARTMAVNLALMDQQIAVPKIEIED